MSKSAHKAIAIVGVGALMPDATNAAAFWQNIKDGRYSIGDVPRDRWNADLYYDPDPSAPDKMYSRIGGWVRDMEWEPLKWKLPIPPKVGDMLDLTQKYAIVTTREALADYGYPERKLDADRTAVIFGIAMGGDNHLLTATRILFPEYAEELSKSPAFAALPEGERATIIEEMRAGVGRRFPDITEDTMPSELSNVTSGRIASLYNLRGTNYVTDAACASAMAALAAAMEGLQEHHFDTVITGGIDANMSPNTYVKFSKIGALSATGTRPYAEGADGFVMGEGAAVFVIKRLEDAERDGDRIYAVIRALGGSSDGRGKGITAPNPIGQKLAVQRAWDNAGIAPMAGDLIEGHGTSTKVGDVVEAESLSEVLKSYGVPPGSVALGSVKSNVGHLKGAAGAAGIFKVAMALHDKVLPPTLNFSKPNPGIDFDASPLRVNTELQEWAPNADGVRRAGVSAFGFGGTNFHVVMEEYVPGRLEQERKSTPGVGREPEPSGGNPSLKAPLRGAMVLGAENEDALRTRLEDAKREAEAGREPAIAPPNESDLRAPVRIAIDYGDAAELADKIGRALTAMEKNEPGRWKVLRARGIFRGRGPAAKSAFLFTGQGSQYVNMLAALREIEPIVADTYAEADEAMKGTLPRLLSDYIFVDENDEAAMKQAHHELKQTVITQPAVLATETAFRRLLSAYGIEPDTVMGHSLGEYGALVAAGALRFDEALRAVSARGFAMTEAAGKDTGTMAAVQATVENIERILDTVDGYVVLANNNSTKESVIGGATAAVEAAMEALRAEGYTVTQLPVSHAFHTRIVAAAGDSLVGILEDMDIRPPRIPVIANVTGEPYPSGPDAEKKIIDLLSRQVAAAVQFVKGLNTLYDSGVRLFAELGPKRALYGFSEAVVGSRDGVSTIFTNHPRVGDIASFNQALCGMYAAGLGDGVPAIAETRATAAEPAQVAPIPPASATHATPAPAMAPPAANMPAAGVSDDVYTQLGHLFAEFLDRGLAIYQGADRTAAGQAPAPVPRQPGVSKATAVRPSSPASAAPAQAVPAPPVEITPAPATADAVQAAVLRIVSEQTGYPADMLEMDLDLEADLGIDTVKQAEMFAAIRAEYNIPRDDNLKLRDYPTLTHTVQFVFEKRPDLRHAAPVAPAAATTAPAVEPASAAATATATTREDAVRTTVLRIVSEQTGYPSDMLEMDLDLEADLGIDTVKQAEMFAAIRAEYDIPRDDELKLRDYPTLNHTVQFVYEKRPDLIDTAPSEATTATAPPAPATETKAATSGDDEVMETVLRIVSEQTGYPSDMLDLDLDLEADLGIDTVKQAEMFAAIRAEYDIPRDDNLRLREYPTLAHTIQFVRDRRPATAASAAAEMPVAAPTERPAEAEGSVPRRAPVPLLRPALEWCKPTGVTLEAGKRVLVMMDSGGVGKALVGRLQKLGVETLVVDDAPAADTLNERIAAWKTAGPVHGVYWLCALDEEAAITDMDLPAWRETTRVRVKLLYHTMRALYDHIGEAGTFLVSATRLGGQHGYDAAGAVAPMGGAVTGFTKSFKREKANATVKAVDFEASRKTAAFADALIDETLGDPGVLEVGYQDGRRWTIGLGEVPIDEGADAPGIVLNADTVFVITGAAGGIVSAITADLATASGGTFHLLDLAPAPERDDAGVKLFGTDREALKQQLVEKLKAGGERVTPRMVETELSTIERQHAAQSAIDAIEKAGGTAHYHCVNMLDGDAVGTVMKTIAEESGRVDVLLHAAGLEISRSLPRKEPVEFELVFDVKSDGWFNVISNLGEMPLNAAVVFSSIAGRFGNAGQADYSSANDLLCKFVSNFRTTRPGTHAVAIDWTAWGGIGMATRGSVPKLLERAGIELLAPEVGLPIVRRELTDGGGGELVIAHGLGAMVAEFDETGGIDTDKLHAVSSMKCIMTQRVLGMGVFSGLVLETTLDPKEQPFLYDHQIDGTPVLPGVMGIEALVEAATLLFPDLHIGSLENVDFASPFKFYRGEPRTVKLQATFEKHDGDVVADCRLVGERKLHGRDQLEVTTHFTARVRLLTQTPEPGKRARVAAPTGAGRVESDEIYKLYFHGPAYQVIENSWRAGGEVVGTFNNNLPANHTPADLPALVSPRLIELCFQTAGISEMAGNATMGLPYHIDEVEFLRPPRKKPKGHYYAAVTTHDAGAYNARVVDDEGNVYLTMRGYRTMQLPGLIEDNLLQPLKDKMTES